MKLLVDEGVDFPIVRHLRDRGYDVGSVLVGVAVDTTCEPLFFEVREQKRARLVS